MNTFTRANETLRSSLEAYAHVLRTIVASMPQIRHLCDRVLKETRLIQALLAFETRSVAGELGQLAFNLSNLWPYREQPYDRTLGFNDEIAEAVRLHSDAQRGLQLVTRMGKDALAGELQTCFTNIMSYLSEEQKLLEECNNQVRPHANNMDITRKQLNLLIAAIDARMPASTEQATTLRAYQEAANLLHDWESGVPLNERGIEILERCLDTLDKAESVSFTK
jgi:uncharacterized coiled-coil protein SlyX